MPERVKFCCPNCGSTEMKSVERVEAVFDVEIVLGEDGGRLPVYSGDREVFADNSDFEGRLECKSCGEELSPDRLGVPSVVAHAKDDVIDIVTETDMGRNLRFRARCTAFAVDYECEWTGEFQYSLPNEREGAAYVRAETDGQTHLAQIRSAVASAG